VSPPVEFGGTVVRGASRSKDHEIRGLDCEDYLVHVTVFNRRHPMMEPA